MVSVVMRRGHGMISSGVTKRTWSLGPRGPSGLSKWKQSVPMSTVMVRARANVEVHEITSGLEIVIVEVALSTGDEAGLRYCDPRNCWRSGRLAWTIGEPVEWRPSP